MQAVFNVSITSDSSLPTLHNTGELTSYPAPPTPAIQNRTTHVFEPTPPMACYLFACFVGELESVEGVYKRGTDAPAMCGTGSGAGGGPVGPAGEEVAVRVWGRVGQSASLKLARDAAIAGMGCTSLLMTSFLLCSSQRVASLCGHAQHQMLVSTCAVALLHVTSTLVLAPVLSSIIFPV